MRKALIIFACVVVSVGVMRARRAANANTVPEVKVTFLGLTNGGTPWPEARFQVLNQGGGRIRVLDIGIQGCEHFESMPLPSPVLKTPLVLQPGIAREVRTLCVPNAPRWRGVVTICRDTPGQRFRNWLLKQPWRSHLPRKWLPDRSGIYILSSPWQDQSLNQPPR